MSVLNKKITNAAIIVLIFAIMITSSNVVMSVKSSTGIDFDPLVDIKVTVEIQKIRTFDKNDHQVHVREYVDRQSYPDFYVKVLINGEEFTSPVWHNTRYVYEPNWSATLNVPDNEEFVYITIQLWDLKDDGYRNDRLCDISGDSGLGSDRYDVELFYSIKTGHWSGDDFINHKVSDADPSGYGRLNGCDDGSIYKHERDAELWFNIYQNDYDNDMIPYWMEVNEYGTNPEANNKGEDADFDGIPIEWEWKWGYDPFAWDNHVNLDPERDGINNLEEYLTSQWYSDPFRKDLFIELDQMEESPRGEKSILPEGAKELLYTAYDRQNIVYHLDDGKWNGSGSDMIPFDESTESSPEGNDELNQIYVDYFLHGNENNWRCGVFHYGVVIYQSSEVNGNAFGNNRFQISSHGMEEKASIPYLNRDVVYASAYMHETGHTLGFWPIPGHNSHSKYPYQLGWWLTRTYKSCMNYGYMYKMVDYSDGSRIIRDYDDWSRMDLTYFQKQIE
ncbi:MAG: hypothetical protein DRO67_10130 [Candidatus Asgardarchaeum californiense]|nr:MAG: hypothetical protein DRO67_10130 [Candidatus Asgardarchaeum californiense]